MFTNLFAGLAYKIIGVGVLALLLGGGALYAGCSIKACVRAQDKAATLEKTLEKTQEVREADKKSEENLKEMSNEELLEFARTGVMPERLRHRTP